MSSTTSLPNIPNLAFAEELLVQYRRDPNSVSAAWREYFDTLLQEQANGSENGHGSTNGAHELDVQLAPTFHPQSLFHCRHQGSTAGSHAGSTPEEADVFSLQFRVDQLVR